MPSVRRFHLVTCLSVACMRSKSLASILPCCAMTALSTFRNSLHSAKFSRASAPLIKYKLLAATIEESMHCDEALCGTARSITSKSKVKRVIFLRYNSLRIMEGYIL